MRLALIHIGQETNDFNPVLTELSDYVAFGILEGDAITAELNQLGQVGGHYAAVAESGLAVETIPIIRAWSGAGGRISREAFDFFQAKIREGLAAAIPIDGLVLQLHGACAAEGIDDVEGEQIALCRSILGADVPIMLGLDHHANITQKIIDNATIIVGHRTQPHDTFDTGKVGTEVLLKVLKDKLKPVIAWRKIPLLSHQEQFLTAKGPMKVWFDRARALEADPRVLQASNYPMQPWLDVAEGGWAAVVVTDDDPALAERLADELADLAWAMRDDFQIKEAVSVDEAVMMADRAAEGVVVISDTGDTVFGGSAGDSNLILEAILRLGIKSRALIPLISPQTVARLAEAGEGATVTLPLGGDAATAFFSPLEVTGTVRKVADGKIPVAFNHQTHIDMGRVVVFDVGPCTLLISELRGVAGNIPAAYEAFGINPSEYKIAVLKTASNFQYFAPISSVVIRADTRGPGQSDVFTLPWRNIPRPVYPLERFEDWRNPQQ
ncbi:MAG: M81 family metallopeptidase [Chelatococcus sp.]|uniref:M81 family metallopeptidase n=1 Tax=unclassified Chelatococcus TaxID=2638111 RepID=UPI001BCC4215|nr:M81 family metallopeptidase [Chelatococcus sp.]MBS7742119.1 M81 family metallopeptidase [Chelatococcus sp. HY11]CAH1647965.1 Microcystin degradation protein MlrC [Hyphomicrobiales bacterium]MBX3537477.1 M81 family metallopeptidase [Chelatococcus sp.]MBX3542763.1 M81 family metallopeptidase [Chelatococcus sp.]MCO5075022.1 M81 family metallopeptidase [Chelatococcus sp.]